MRDRLNIFTMLCKDVDQNEQSFLNTFDTIIYGEDGIVDFNIVFFINILGNKSYYVRVMMLFFKNENNDDRPLSSVISDFIIPPNENNCKTLKKQKISVMGSRGVNQLKLAKFKLLGKGRYEILVFSKKITDEEKDLKKLGELKTKDLELSATAFFNAV